jgi:hypothetical protein
VAVVGVLEAIARIKTDLLAGDVAAAQRQMRRLSYQMESVGTTLATKVTAPLALMGAYAVREAAKFETAFTGVTKTVNGTQPQFEKLSKEIVDLSKKLPFTASEFAKFAQIGGQMNVPIEKMG